jgi:hypothetical protein
VLFLVYYTNKGALGAVMVVLSEWLRQALLGLEAWFRASRVSQYAFLCAKMIVSDYDFE